MFDVDWISSIRPGVMLRNDLSIAESELERAKGYRSDDGIIMKEEIQFNELRIYHAS